MKNLKEFKELIERYETVTIEEIREQWKITKKDETRIGSVPHYTAQKLTGFGGSITCTLCLAIEQKCEQCVLSINSTDDSYHCLNFHHRPTYDGINFSKSPAGLLTALRNRAKHYREFYKEIL